MRRARTPVRMQLAMPPAVYHNGVCHSPARSHQLITPTTRAHTAHCMVAVCGASVRRHPSAAGTDGPPSTCAAAAGEAPVTPPPQATGAVVPFPRRHAGAPAAWAQEPPPPCDRPLRPALTRPTLRVPGGPAAGAGP